MRNKKQFIILATSIGISSFAETGSFEFKAPYSFRSPIDEKVYNKPKKLKYRETPNSSKFHR